MPNDLGLAGHFVRVEDRVKQRIREDIDSGAQGVSGECRVVDRHVEGGVRVDASPRAFHISGNVAHAATLGALEEHVFVEVGQAFFTRPLVGGTHIDPELQVDHRCQVGFPQQDREAVRQDLVMNAGCRQAWRVPEPGRSGESGWSFLSSAP